MKKTMITIIVIISISILISSVCAVPHVTYNEMKRLSDQQIEQKIDTVLNSKCFQKIKKFSPTTPDIKTENMVKELTSSFSNAPYYPKLCALLIGILTILKSFMGAKFIGKAIIFTVMVSLTFIASLIIGIFNIPNAIIIVTASIVYSWTYVINELKPYFLLGLIGLILTILVSIPIGLILYVIGVPILVAFNIVDTFLNTLTTVYSSEV